VHLSLKAGLAANRTKNKHIDDNRKGDKYIWDLH